jgi:hypothetical protein
MAVYGLYEHAQERYMVELMMKTTTLLGVFAVAGAAGFLGGALNSQLSVYAASPTVIKASRFELTNGAGITLAVWEADSKNGAHLRFLPTKGHSRVEIGVNSNGTPSLQMDGLDGKNRFAVRLDAADKPYLEMSDERWAGRVSLGFIEQDMYDPKTDDWGLSFRGFGSQRSIAEMGMTKTASGEPTGFLAVSGEQIR